MPVDLILYLAIVIPSLRFCLMRGQAPEKIAAAIIALDTVCDLVLFSFEDVKPFAKLSYGMMIADLTILAAYLALALRANRVWPITIAASQLVVSTSHLAMFAEDGMQRAYWAMSQLPLLIQVPALIIGTMAHRSREAEVGPYRNWRDERTQFKPAKELQT